MSYYKKVLQPGEQVLYNKGLHWIVYFPAILAFFAALVCAYVFNRESTSTVPAFSLGGFLLFVAVILFLRGWILRLSTEIVVTDKRIILKKGLFIAQTIEMNMSKVETVDVVQSIIGSMLDYGTVIIRGIGSTYEPLEKVASPLQLRNVIIVK